MTSQERQGREGPVVTLDGPAGSGKSTTAKEVARRLGYRHLDSGALYRSVTFALLDAGVPARTWPALTREDLVGLGVTVHPTGEGFEIRLRGRPLGPELRSADVTAHVSALALLPAARAALLGLQREAGAAGRLVADGRDMGSVVFPRAEVKVFLVADLKVRARRRLLERREGEPTPGEVDDEARRIAERDRVDSQREISPLRRPDGAVDLDTTALSFEAQVRTVVDLVRSLGTGDAQGVIDRHG
ncbi:MAG TPA: (d)CMP kinase [Longimicrobiales bacterium]|nr:(d)CMP kinase [Longimicrobiales bacterium]